MSLSPQSPHYGKAGGKAEGAKPPAAREVNLKADQGCRADILGMKGSVIRWGAVTASPSQGPTPKLTEAHPGYTGGCWDTGQHGKWWDSLFLPAQSRMEGSGGQDPSFPGDQEASGWDDERAG